MLAAEFTEDSQKTFKDVKVHFALYCVGFLEGTWARLIPGAIHGFTPGISLPNLSISKSTNNILWQLLR